MASEASMRREERGIALVLAMLSLMILTFLGLALATATSTELQIATNYRWGQQAFYNAEAGIEAGRVVLSNMISATQPSWVALLPTVRVGWTPGVDAVPDPVETLSPVTAEGRDFEKRSCDTTYNMGYGRVIRGATLGRFEYLHSFEGRNLNGAFTLWVRRPVIADTTGQLHDDLSNANVILVSEGVAPFTGTNAFTRAHQAVRVLEIPLTFNAGKSCGDMAPQEGVSSTGSGYNPCTPITDSVEALSGASAFGTAGEGDTGSLQGTGVR